MEGPRDCFWGGGGSPCSGSGRRGEEGRQPCSALGSLGPTRGEGPAILSSDLLPSYSRLSARSASRQRSPSSPDLSFHLNSPPNPCQFGFGVGGAAPTVALLNCQLDPGPARQPRVPTQSTGADGQDGGGAGVHGGGTGAAQGPGRRGLGHLGSGSGQSSPAPSKEEKPQRCTAGPQTAGTSQAPSLELWGSFEESVGETHRE